MTQLWRYRKALNNQVENVGRILTRRPVNLTSLGSMTLDIDDVQVARKWLKQSDSNSSWTDTNTTTRYQQQFAKWNGSQHAFAFTGGRVALSACLYALNIKQGDEIIVPGYTCVVVPNAMKYVGIRPVYSDIELDTYGLDVTCVRKLITPKTKAILLHHLFGLVCRDYDLLLELAQKYNIAVIEDCAHATGAKYCGENIGNLSSVAFYSSEQSKVFNTIQGGIAITNDDEISDRLQSYWNSAHYQNNEFTRKLLYNVLLNYYGEKHHLRWILGDITNILYGEFELESTTQEEIQGIKPKNYGAKMSAPIADIGINQLKKIDYYNKLRRKNAERWLDWCKGHGYQTPSITPRSEPVFLRYPVLVEEHMKVDHTWAEEELGINLGLWFTSHTHPSKSHFPNLPQACKAVNSCVNFPTLF